MVKVVSKVLLFFLLSVLFSCSILFFPFYKDDTLTLKKEKYTGDLRIDGYYYFLYGSDKHAITIFFYENGTALITGSPELQNGLSDVEEYYKDLNIWLQGDGNHKYSWGVFNVKGDSICYEKWYPSSGPIHSYIRSGEILNDSTFMTNRSMRKGKEEIEPERIFHFRKYSPKLDSTNNYLD